MGTLGKSSLAARVVSRQPRKPIVIFDRYDSLAIFDVVVKALPPEPRVTERTKWRQKVIEDPSCLAEALESWLSNSLNEKPILLIIR
jgi:hypothetical protein